MEKGVGVEGVGRRKRPHTGTVEEAPECEYDVDDFTPESEERLWVLASSALGSYFDIILPKEEARYRKVNARQIDCYPLFQAFAVACRVDKVSD